MAVPFELLLYGVFSGTWRKYYSPLKYSNRSGEFKSDIRDVNKYFKFVDPSY